MRLSYREPDMFAGGIDEWPFGKLEPGAYGCIAADPPWHFKVRSSKGEGRSPEYDVMSDDDIAALPVADLALPDAVLLLWATNPMLPQAIATMERWGFAYKTIGFCWAKTTSASLPNQVPKYHMGLGYWSRSNVELCLLGVRGRPQRVGRGVRQLIVSPVREHSRKPELFYESAQALVRGPYVELFARTRRAGWSVWGNQVDMFGEVRRAEAV